MNRPSPYLSIKRVNVIVLYIIRSLSKTRTFIFNFFSTFSARYEQLSISVFFLYVSIWFPSFTLELFGEIEYFRSMESDAFIESSFCRVFSWIVSNEPKTLFLLLIPEKFPETGLSENAFSLF